MSLRVPKEWEKYRVVMPGPGGAGSSSSGLLRIPAEDVPPFPGIPDPCRLAVVMSDGEGWDHVSVSTMDRCPTWWEMEWIKRALWDPRDTVMQLHVPVADHKNHHEYCLHMWRPQLVKIPRPPSNMVA